MQSVTRMHALEKQWCVEGVVERDSVTDGEIVWLGNAVRGFFAGKIWVSVGVPVNALSSKISGP